MLPRANDTSAILAVAALLVLLALAKQSLEMAYTVLNSYAGEQLLLSFRAKLFRHSQRLSLAYHDSAGPYDSVYRIQYDAPAIHWITLDAFIPLLSSLFTLVAMTMVIAGIHWSLALVALAVAPVLDFGLSFLRSPPAPWLARSQGPREHDHGRPPGSAVAVRLVKVFGQEEREEERHVRHARRTVRQQVRLAGLAGSFALVSGLCIAVATAAVLFIGVRHVHAGLTSLGRVDRRDDVRLAALHALAGREQEHREPPGVARERPARVRAARSWARGRGTPRRALDHASGGPGHTSRA